MATVSPPPAKVRSSDGCWTCRLRRKKCDEARPVCGSCGALEIQCRYGEAKPDWMDGAERQRAAAEALKHTIKRMASVRRDRKFMQQQQQQQQQQQRAAGHQQDAEVAIEGRDTAAGASGLELSEADDTAMDMDDDSGTLCPDDVLSRTTTASHDMVGGGGGPSRAGGAPDVFDNGGPSGARRTSSFSGASSYQQDTPTDSGTEGNFQMDAVMSTIADLQASDLECDPDFCAGLGMAVPKGPCTASDRIMDLGPPPPNLETAGGMQMHVPPPQPPPPPPHQQHQLALDEHGMAPYPLTDPAPDWVPSHASPLLLALSPNLEVERDLNSVLIYLDYVFPYMFPFYRPPLLEGGRGWLLVLLMRNKALFHTALSMASYFFSVVLESTGETDALCRQSNWQQLQRQQALALRELQREVDALQRREEAACREEAPRPSYVESSRVVESILQMLVFGVAIGEESKGGYGHWQMHLDAALGVYMRLVERHAETPMGRPGASNPRPCFNILDELAGAWGEGGGEEEQRPHETRPGRRPWTSDQAAFRFFGAVLVMTDVVAATALGRSPGLAPLHHHMLKADSCTCPLDGCGGGHAPDCVDGAALAAADSAAAAAAWSPAWSMPGAAAKSARNSTNMAAEARAAATAAVGPAATALLTPPLTIETPPSCGTSHPSPAGSGLGCAEAAPAPQSTTTTTPCGAPSTTPTDSTAQHAAQQQQQQQQQQHDRHGHHPSQDPRTDLAEFLGTQNWTIVLIGAVASLDAWKKAARSRGELDVVELVTRAAAIESALRRGLARADAEAARFAAFARLARPVPYGAASASSNNNNNSHHPPTTSPLRREPPRATAALANAVAAATAAPPASRPLDAAAYLTPFSTSQAPPTATALAVNLHSRLWARAALAYLAVVVHGWQPRLPAIRAEAVATRLLFDDELMAPAALAAAAGLEAALINNVAGGGGDSARPRQQPSVGGEGGAACLRTLAWPFCVAGCLAEGDDEEAWFRSAVANVGALHVFSTVKEALAVMEEVWKRRKLGTLDARAWDIAECLGVLGHKSLLL